MVIVVAFIVAGFLSCNGKRSAQPSDAEGSASGTRVGDWKLHDGKLPPQALSDALENFSTWPKLLPNLWPSIPRS